MNPQAPSVIWLMGSACTGCSISLLNRISDQAGEPATVAELLAATVNLVFHPIISKGRAPAPRAPHR